MNEVVCKREAFAKNNPKSIDRPNVSHEGIHPEASPAAMLAHEHGLPVFAVAKSEREGNPNVVHHLTNDAEKEWSELGSVKDVKKELTTEQIAQAALESFGRN